MKQRVAEETVHCKIGMEAKVLRKSTTALRVAEQSEYAGGLTKLWRANEASPVPRNIGRCRQHPVWFFEELSSSADVLTPRPFLELSHARPGGYYALVLLPFGCLNVVYRQHYPVQ